MAELNKQPTRMDLICAFIKTGKQPEGFKITETKSGKYRLTKIKNDKELLEARRQRLQKAIDNIDVQINKLNEESKKQNETTGKDNE